MLAASLGLLYWLTHRWSVAGLERAEELGALLGLSPETVRQHLNGDRHAFPDSDPTAAA